MKKLILLILFSVKIIPVAAQDDDKKLILTVLENQRMAWNRGDIPEYMQGYLKSDSLLFVGKSGPKYGWENTLANYQKSYPDKQSMGFLSFRIRQVKLFSPDHAFVLGAWHLKREKDEPQGYFTLILIKVQGQWKIMADHSS